MNAVHDVPMPDAHCLAVGKPALLGRFDLLVSSSGGVSKLRDLVLALAVRGATPSRLHVLRVTSIGAPPALEAVSVLAVSAPLR